MDMSDLRKLFNKEQMNSFCKNFFLRNTLPRLDTAPFKGILYFPSSCISVSRSINRTNKFSIAYAPFHLIFTLNDKFTFSSPAMSLASDFFRKGIEDYRKLATLSDSKLQMFAIVSNFSERSGHRGLLCMSMPGMFLLRVDSQTQRTVSWSSLTNATILKQYPENVPIIKGGRSSRGASLEGRFGYVTGQNRKLDFVQTSSSSKEKASANRLELVQSWPDTGSRTTEHMFDRILIGTDPFTYLTGLDYSFGNSGNISPTTKHMLVRPFGDALNMWEFIKPHGIDKHSVVKVDSTKDLYHVRLI